MVNYSGCRKTTEILEKEKSEKTEVKENKENKESSYPITKFKKGSKENDE